jgi:hypothetical protein
MVFSCRTQEYRSARHLSSLYSFAVIEILPVNMADAIEYLMAHTLAPERERWLPVVRQLRGTPHTPLAQALSTPLMLEMARLAYGPPGADPKDLLRYPTREAVEEYLLEQYLAAIYREEAGTSWPLHRHRRRFTPEQAQRWLHNLALLVARRDANEIKWWEITTDDGRPTLLRGLVLGFIIGIFSGLAIFASNGPAVGIASGVASALVVLTGWIQAPRVPSPRRLDSRLTSIVRRVLFRIGSSLAAGLGAGLGVGAWLGTAAGVVGGLAVGFGVALWLRMGDGLGYILDTSNIVSPRATLSLDRAATAWSLLIVSSLCGSVTGVTAAFLTTKAFGLSLGAVVGLVAATIVALNSAWVRLRVTSVSAALTGRVPLHLMDFLEDAQARGVLRQASGVYQFRHRALQDRLVHDRSVRTGRRPN